MFTTLQAHPHVHSATAAQTKSMLVQRIINCSSRLVKDVDRHLCAFFLAISDSKFVVIGHK